MSSLLGIVKFFLLALSGVGFYLTWYLFLKNGSADMMTRIRDDGPHVLPFTDEAPLKNHYTGISVVDYQLTVLVLFFYNVIDGSHPNACLQAYHFTGQIASGWSLLVLESLRFGNRWRIVSFITLWGLVMQNVAFAVTIPVYCAIHLSTSPTVWSRKHSDLLLDPVKLKSIPCSIALGLIVPTTALTLPAPSVISHQRKQTFLAIWQAFPLWVGILQEVIPPLQRVVIGKATSVVTKKQTVDSMRTVYAIMLTAAVVTRISTWTILDSAVLFPSIFTPDVAHLLTPSAVLKPVAATPLVKMPSIVAGALQFLQYDEMVGAAAMMLWSSALYLNATEKGGLGGWISLVIKGMVIEALAGPQGFAVAAVWARDEIIFAQGHGTGKKDL